VRLFDRHGNLCRKRDRVRIEDARSDHEPHAESGADPGTHSIGVIG